MSQSIKTKKTKPATVATAGRWVCRLSKASAIRSLDKNRLHLSLLIFLSSIFLSVAADLPPPIPGYQPTLSSPRQTGSSVTRMSVAIPGPTNRGTFYIEIKDQRPEQIISFYVATNAPARWMIERSADLVIWKPLFRWDATNAQPRSVIPRLRDDAKLVDWLIEKPKAAQFYRFTVLP